MARHKNVEWRIPEKAQTWEQVDTAVLMDLRDELKEMNQSLRCLRCINFLRIPAKLDAIRRNTAKKIRKKA